MISLNSILKLIMLIEEQVKITRETIYIIYSEEVKELLPMTKGISTWGEPHSQKVRCEEIKLKTINSLVFHDGFAAGHTRFNVICANSIQKNLHIAKFTSSKSELPYDIKCRCAVFVQSFLRKDIIHLSFLCLLSMALSYFCVYDYDLTEEVFEKSPDKQNNDISTIKLIFNQVNKTSSKFDFIHFLQRLIDKGYSLLDCLWTGKNLMWEKTIEKLYLSSSLNPFSQALERSSATYSA
jgi:hypothetical protein